MKRCTDVLVRSKIRPTAPSVDNGGHAAGAPDVSKIVNPNDLKAGDVIGFSGNSWISALINIGTYGIPFWGISHVGVMAHAADGRLLLFESTTLENMPCEISGECFNGTQAHDLNKILKAYAARSGISALSAALRARRKAVDRVSDGHNPHPL